MEEEIRKQIELFTNLSTLPKIDLRVLLTGSIRKTTLLKLLPPENQSKLEKLFSRISYEDPSIFSDISTECLKDLETVRQVTKEIFEDWKKHSTIYLELRTFLLSQKDKYTKEEFLTAVLEEINNFNEFDSSQRMTVRLIISLDRKDNLNELEEIYNIYKNYSNPDLKKLIVGIDYSGHENGQKLKYQEIIPLLKKFKDEGLGVSVHYGENPNYQKFPFDIFTPDRISNGSFLKVDDINEVLERNIPIEICPTLSYKITHQTEYSRIPMNNFWNKKTKSLKDGEEFVFKNIALCSDCRTLMLTDISQELHEIGISFGFGIKELKDIMLNCINFAFEKDENVRNKLRTFLEKYHI